MKKYWILIGAIFSGGAGTVAMVLADASNSLWNEASWMLFITAFILLDELFDHFGVAIGFALFGSGTAVFVIIAVYFLGPSWGEQFNTWHYLAAVPLIVGFIGLLATDDAL